MQTQLQGESSGHLLPIKLPSLNPSCTKILKLPWNINSTVKRNSKHIRLNAAIFQMVQCYYVDSHIDLVSKLVFLIRTLKFNLELGNSKLQPLIINLEPNVKCYMQDVIPQPC